MTYRDDLLIEIHTEELPPKTLLKLAKSFYQQVKDALEKAAFEFNEIKYFATPRRLALIVYQLVDAQKDQIVERRGPALQAAFDKEGNPTKACVGFAQSLGITPNELIHIKNKQGEWVGYQQPVRGQTIHELLPKIISDALLHLPISKRMRWGDKEISFVRPVHSVILLYGDKVIDATILGCKTDRKTRGHRFHAPGWLSIPHTSDYLSLLSSKGKVIANFSERQNQIQEQATALIKNKLGQKHHVVFTSDEFLDEVTGLVEWPAAVCGQFDADFLNLPKEILVSAMQDHQRYFPVIDENQSLAPYFITISNIESSDVNRLIHGNERVLRARLSDADFFYRTDKKPLFDRLEKLKDIVFQAKLGSLFQKSERLSALSVVIAKELGLPEKEAERAGLLAKTDLTTNLVNEFPELQGTIGFYYAKRDQENESVARALEEQYMPRFSGSVLPSSPIGQVLAIADRIDTLIGTFGLNHLPTGDKDPYGLRRAALGIIRILIEKQLNLDLILLLKKAISLYEDQKISLINQEIISQVFNFIQERLRAWYSEKGITADVFASVSALNISNLYDMDARIQAVKLFKQRDESNSLCMANKRVSNILSKADTVSAHHIDSKLFEFNSEKELDELLQKKVKALKPLQEKREYQKILLELAELNDPLDQFFKEVMVMSENKAQRENRLLLLSQLRILFLQVADIALLQ